jgi:hypothetical protein
LYEGQKRSNDFFGYKDLPMIRPVHFMDRHRIQRCQSVSVIRSILAVILNMHMTP